MKKKRQKSKKKIVTYNIREKKMDSTSSRQQLSHHSIANLFYSDVVKWRQLAAKLWSLVIVFALVLIHSTTANHALLTDLTGFITG